MNKHINYLKQLQPWSPGDFVLDFKEFTPYLLEDRVQSCYVIVPDSWTKPHKDLELQKFEPLKIMKQTDEIINKLLRTTA